MSDDKRRLTRKVVVTFILDEDPKFPWTAGPRAKDNTSVMQWLKDNLDFKEDVIEIEDIYFPDGEYGDEQ